jgi:hypothetical protein
MHKGKFLLFLLVFAGSLSFAQISYTPKTDYLKESEESSHALMMWNQRNKVASLEILYNDNYPLPEAPGEEEGWLPDAIPVWLGGDGLAVFQYDVGFIHGDSKTPFTREPHPKFKYWDDCYIVDSELTHGRPMYIAHSPFGSRYAKYHWGLEVSRESFDPAATDIGLDRVFAHLGIPMIPLKFDSHPLDDRTIVSREIPSEYGKVFVVGVNVYVDVASGDIFIEVAQYDMDTAGYYPVGRFPGNTMFRSAVIYDKETRTSRYPGNLHTAYYKNMKP